MKGGKGWNMILAADLKGGIGLRNDLPWKIPQDLKHFQKLTRGTAERESVVVMGRNTWQSIPEKFRPLKVGAHRFQICSLRRTSTDMCRHLKLSVDVY